MKKIQLFMKSIGLSIMALLFLLGSCGETKTEQQNQDQDQEEMQLANDTLAIAEEQTPIIQKKDYPREGIQWGDFHIKLLEHQKQNITLVFTASDGTIDSLAFIDNYDEDGFLGFNDVSLDNIHEEDINFDGIPDLQIHMGLHDDNLNHYYKGFVWDKENGGFVIVPNYDEILNPSVYAKEQCIVSTYHGIYAPAEDGQNPMLSWYCEKYQWVDGSLVMTKTWDKAVDSDELNGIDFDAWFNEWMEEELSK